MRIYHTRSSRGTKKAASLLARKVLKSPPMRHAVVVALIGELGSGKTTFVQGFFKELGLKKKPASPTFILIRRTALRRKYFTNIFHIDAYRLRKPDDLKKVGLCDILSDSRNIVLIEWADKVRDLLPKGAIWVAFSHGRTKCERKVTVRAPKQGV